MLEIEYEFREQDLIHFNELRLSKSGEMQKNIRKHRLIVPAIMTLLAFFNYAYYQDRMSAGYVLLFALLWAIFAPKIMIWDMRRQILTNYTDKEKVNMFGTYTLAIDPANPKYLLEKSPSGKHKMAWEDLVRVEYGNRYVYIYIDLNTALVIPVETIKKGNLEQFAEQAEKMIERAA